MFAGLKAVIKNLVYTTPGVNRLFFRYWVDRFRYSDEVKLRAQIGALGHALDCHPSTCGERLGWMTTHLEFLLKEALRQRIEFDAQINWATHLLARTRCKSDKEGAPQEGSQSDSAVLHQADYVAMSSLIRGRRSIRKWCDDKAVPIGELRDIISDAAWAPSSCNRQPWQIMLLTSRQDIMFLSQYLPNRFYLKAQVLLLVVVDRQIYQPNERSFAYLDAGAFIENLVLLAHAKGLGACWIGFKGWDCHANIFLPGNLRKEFYRYFGVSPDKVPVSAVALGYPAERPQGPPRRPFDSMIIRTA